MKHVISFKSPDAVDATVQQAKDDGCSKEEIVHLKKLCDKYFEDGEYVYVQIDTDTDTCEVLRANP